MISMGVSVCSLEEFLLMLFHGSCCATRNNKIMSIKGPVVASQSISRHSSSPLWQKWPSLSFLTFLLKIQATLSELQAFAAFKTPQRHHYSDMSNELDGFDPWIYLCRMCKHWHKYIKSIVAILPCSAYSNICWLHYWHHKHLYHQNFLSLSDITKMILGSKPHPDAIRDSAQDLFIGLDRSKEFTDFWKQH